MLIENGENVNERDDKKLTVLHWAANFGQFEIVKMLVENGANINAIDINKLTPLLACVFGNDQKTSLGVAESILRRQHIMEIVRVSEFLIFSARDRVIRDFLCTFVCEGWGLWFGWRFEAPAHLSATIL